MDSSNYGNKLNGLSIRMQLSSIVYCSTADSATDWLTMQNYANEREE